MTRLNALPGQYNKLHREDIFPDQRIAELADKYHLDFARLKETLENVVLSYDYDGHWSVHFPQWLKASNLATESLEKLQELRALWADQESGVRQTIAATFDNYSAAIMITQIDNMIAVMTELGDCAGRRRGNPGDARTSVGINTLAFKNCVVELNQFWMSQKNGNPIEPKVQHDEVYDNQGNPTGKEVAVAKSDGLAFLHACLIRLDPRITVATCRSILCNLPTITHKKAPRQKLKGRQSRHSRHK